MAKKALEEFVPKFDYRAIQEITSVQDCQLVFLSPETIQLCISAIRLAEYPTRWVNLNGIDNNPVSISVAISLYHNAIKELTMSCDLSELNDKLERIAIALEGINEKTSERLTWDEMIDDLETTLGIGNAFVEVLRWIGNLIPSLKAKVDITPLVTGFWEYYSWKAPILANLTAMNASLGALAASSVAEKPLSVLRTIFAGFDSILNLNKRIYEFILGDWNWYDNLLKPFWDSFISPDNGGTADTPDPDNDSGLRPIINLSNNIVDSDTFSPNINVSCAGCGGSGSCSCGGSVGGGSFVLPEPAPGQPGIGLPPEDWNEGTGGVYDQYKCNAATFLADSYTTYVNNFTSLSGILTTLSPALFFSPMPDKFMALLSPAAAFALFAYLVTTFIGFSGLTALLAAYKGNLEETKEDFICQLMEALDVASARAVIEAWIADNMPVGLPESWVEYHSENLFTNAIINILFVEYAPIVGDNANCEFCLCEPEFLPQTVLDATASVSVNGNEVTVTLAYASSVDQWRADVFFRNAEDNELWCEKWIEITDATGISDDGPPEIWAIWSGGNTINQYTADAFPTQPYRCDAITVRSNTPGSFTFVWSNEEPE